MLTIKKHKVPEDPDTIILKYLDLSKFLDLLMSKTFHVAL
jgi:hypothetical protein